MYDWYGIVRRQNDNEMILFPSVAYMYVYEKAGSTFPKNMLCPWTLLQDERTQNDFSPLPYSIPGFIVGSR